MLAYLRRYDDQQVLCVANLSRFAQPVDLDLPELEGVIPVEMLGYVDFPPIGKQPYRLTLGPYGFFWLELHGESKQLEAAASQWTRRRWWRIAGSACWRAPDDIGWSPCCCRISCEAAMVRREGPAHPHPPESRTGWRCRIRTRCLALVEVQYEKGEPDTYFLPLGAGVRQGRGAECRKPFRTAIVAPAISSSGPGFLHDAVYDDRACAAFLSFIEHAKQAPARNGLIRGVPGAEFAALRGPAETRSGRAARLGGTEQHLAAL